MGFKSFFTGLMDKVKAVISSDWFQSTFKYITNNIVKPLIEDLGEEVTGYIKGRMVFAATQDWSAGDKFKYVFNETKTKFTAKNLKTSALNAGINLFYLELKKQGII